MKQREEGLLALGDSAPKFLCRYFCTFELRHRPVRPTLIGPSAVLDRGTGIVCQLKSEELTLIVCFSNIYFLNCKESN